MCEAVLDGSVIRVSTHASTVMHVEEGDVCPTVCAVIEATCSLGPLAAGTYDIHIGEDTRAVEVPGTDERCDPNYIAE